MAKIIENPSQLILDHAREIFNEKGYGQLTMRGVASACGIALGTIYNYFPNKGSLVVELMADYWKTFQSDLEVILARPGSFPEKLHGVYNSLESFIGKFKSEWLKPELYQAEEVMGSSRGRKIQALENLVVRLSQWLNDEGIHLRNLTSQEGASFIVMNFLALLQTPLMEYEVLEKIILSLVEE